MPKKKTSGEPKTNGIANWYGTDRMIAPAIASLLVGCSWVGIPCVGSCAVLRWMKARTYGINDIHRHLMNLVRVARSNELRPALIEACERKIHHPDELAEAQLTCLAMEAKYIDTPDQMVMFGDPDPIKAVMPVEPVPDLQWAIAYFVCSWMGRSSRAGTKGEFANGQSLRWEAQGGGSATRYFSAVSALEWWGEILQRCECSAVDVFQFLRSAKDISDNGLYIDPPFLGAGDLYRYQLPGGNTITAHAQLAQACMRFENARVVLRYHDRPEVNSIYRTSEGWEIIKLTGRKQTNEKASELLICRNVPRSILDQALLPTLEDQSHAAP